MTRYFVVMVGGAIGAVSRFIAGSLVVRFYPGAFPLGTFLINVTGSFSIGLLMTFFLDRPGVGSLWRLFLVTGVLGGYTTFSSFEWETLSAFRTGEQAIALLYIGLSVAMGLGGAWLGSIIAGRVWPQ